MVNSLYSRAGIQGSGWAGGWIDTHTHHTHTHSNAQTHKNNRNRQRAVKGLLLFKRKESVAALVRRALFSAKEVWVKSKRIG